MTQGPYNPYAYNAPGPYMAPPGGGGPTGPSGGDYEFNDAENAVVAKAAFWAKLLGIFMIVSGVAALVSCNVINFVINLVVGITFLGASTSLTSVVNTQGNDIVHMMAALQKLRTAFKIRVIVVLVALAIIMVVGVLLVVVLLLAPHSR